MSPSLRPFSHWVFTGNFLCQPGQEIQDSLGRVSPDYAARTDHCSYLHRNYHPLELETTVAKDYMKFYNYGEGPY